MAACNALLDEAQASRIGETFGVSCLTVIPPSYLQGRIYWYHRVIHGT